MDLSDGGDPSQPNQPYRYCAWAYLVLATFQILNDEAAGAQAN
jgi:hypothetical protein